MSIRIYVGNLSLNTDEGNLKSLFEEYGVVDSVKVIAHQFTYRFRVFAFVEMQNREEGLKAIKELDSRTVGGRNLKVNEMKASEGLEGL